MSVFVKEYERMAKDAQGNLVPVGDESGFTLDHSPLTISSSSATAAFNNKTRFILVKGDEDFHFAVGSSPTATTNHMHVDAGVMLFLGVKPGQKLAAITDA